jgi:hypothetical protein
VGLLIPHRVRPQVSGVERNPETCGRPFRRGQETRAERAANLQAKTPIATTPFLRHEPCGITTKTRGRSLNHRLRNHDAPFQRRLTMTSSSVFDRIVQLLDRYQVHYEVLRHDPVYTSQQAALVRGTSGPHLQSR